MRPKTKIDVILGDHREIRHQLAKSERCPYLCGLRAATMRGLVEFCEARQKVNRQYVRRKLNSMLASKNVVIGETLAMNKFPACFECKMYKSLKKGRLPSALKHVRIIKAKELRDWQLSRIS